MAEPEDGSADTRPTAELRRLRRLLDHGAWADRALLAGLRNAGPPRGRNASDAEPPATGDPSESASTVPHGDPAGRLLRAAWREYAHLLAAQEVWLARLEGRPPSTSVWPVLSPEECEALREAVAAGYETYVGDLAASALSTDVRYANSAGREFTSSVGDILLHVALHGQYHRGKANLLLRQAGEEPVPTDYIGFVRGSPAARTEVDR